MLNDSSVNIQLFNASNKHKIISVLLRDLCGEKTNHKEHRGTKRKSLCHLLQKEIFKAQINSKESKHLNS